MSRKTSGAKSSTKRDPILDDGEEDSTAITTYVSCRKCFNSMMLHPDQFRNGPINVRCNVCDLRAKVTITMLETIDGNQFDVEAWMNENAMATFPSGPEDA